MSGPALRYPLLQLLADEYANEVERHQGGDPGAEVWHAQVDAFASHVATRVVAVIDEEVRAALTATPNVVCLHKAAAALDTVVREVGAAVDVFLRGLVAVEDEFIAMTDRLFDEGGEG